MDELHAETIRTIEAAIARRGERFALGDLTLTAAGYSLKFRADLVDIVRTAIPETTIADPATFDKLLDGIRRAFWTFNPWPDQSTKPLTTREAAFSERPRS